MSQRLDEGPLVVDRLVQLVFGESLRPGDRLRPLVFEGRPRCAHALRVRRTEHRAQRVPRVTLVHVCRDVDAVDDNRVDQRVDVDVDKPGVADLRVGEVDVAEAGAAEIGAPEHGSRKIPSNSSGMLPPVASLPFSVQFPQVCRNAAALSSGATK